MNITKTLIFSLLILFIKLQYDLPKELKEIQEDAEHYTESEYSESSAFPVKLKTPNAQCCMLKMVDSEEEEEFCSLFGGSTKEAQQFESSTKIQSLLKEIFGFTVYGMSEFYENDSEELANSLRHKQIYKCKDGDYTFSYGYYNYTSQEKAILKSSKHCLRYFYSYVLDEDFLNNMPSKDKCFNADISESSKNNGIECGYYEFNIKFVSGKSKIFKSCYLLSNDIFSTKKIESESKANFQAMGVMFAQYVGETFLSYSLDLSDSKGNKLSYDSLNDKVSNPSQQGSSQIAFYSKYLFLFILFLF